MAFKKKSQKERRIERQDRVESNSAESGQKDSDSASNVDNNSSESAIVDKRSEERKARIAALRQRIVKLFYYHSNKILGL